MFEFIKKNWVMVVSGIILFFVSNQKYDNNISYTTVRTDSIGTSIMNFLGICKYCLLGVVIGVYFKDSIAKFLVNVGRNFMINDIVSSSGSFLTSNKSVQNKEHKVRSALAGV